MHTYVLVRENVNNGLIESIVAIFFDSELAESERARLNIGESDPDYFDKGFHYEVYEHSIVGEPPSIMNKGLLS